MDELLDRCYDRVDAAAFIQHLESGLKVGAGGLWQDVPMPRCAPAWLPALLPPPCRPCPPTHQPSTPQTNPTPSLQDHYDVKTVCHPILSKLAAIAPGQVRWRQCQRQDAAHAGKATPALDDD